MAEREAVTKDEREKKAAAEARLKDVHESRKQTLEAEKREEREKRQHERGRHDSRHSSSNSRRHRRRSRSRLRSPQDRRSKEAKESKKKVKDEEEKEKLREDAIKSRYLEKEPAEQEFVLVKDIVSGETMELPTQREDHTLGLPTLTRAIPGAHGLKYKTDNGVTRALLIDSSGKKFIAPNTGWAGKCFTVIYNSGAPVSASVAVSNPGPPRAEPSWRSTSDQNAKRKKMMDDGNSTDSDHSVSGGHRQLTAKQKRTDEPEKSEAKRLLERPKDMQWLISLRQYALYYGDINSGKRCVTPISTNIVATYAHGSHQHLTVESTKFRPILIRNYFNENYSIPARVLKRDDGLDVVLLQAVDNVFFSEPPAVAAPEIGMRYKMFGLSNKENRIESLSLGFGIVTAKYDNKCRYLGSSGSAKGDSGAGIWNSNGVLIGMNIMVRKNGVILSEREPRQYTYATGASTLFVDASVICLFASEYIPYAPPIDFEE